jgi:hypothetical protein
MAPVFFMSLDIYYVSRCMIIKTELFLKEVSLELKGQM